MTAPAVSIVLISYNDAARLPRAIDAALAQTLRDIEVIVVDDCSTDGTEALVRARMAADPRLRYLRRAENSGGCSAPRNLGIVEARGTWVMFCDSDDELEVHAAKGLLLAVEEAEADLGCGVVERVDVRTGTSVRWRAELHAPAVLHGIGERPDLIADTVSVNKIYRRSFLVERGITFPEGLLYEDQLFTMRAYAEAARIVVLDQTVYRWHVDRLAEELSITQRRRELRNVRDRIAVNVLIDEYLASAGRADLVPVKQAKFLRHEMYLYLAAVLDADDETADALMRELADYARTVDLSLAAGLRAPLRIAIYHLMVGDRDGVRDAMKTVRWSAVLPERIRTDDGRDLWACAHLDDAPAVQGLSPQWWLDLTAYHPSLAPLTDQRHCHEVERLEVTGSRIEVSGHTVDAYGVLGRVQRASLALVSGDRVVAELPLAFGLGLDGSARWSGRGRLRSVGGVLVEPPDAGTVSVVLEVDGVRSIMPIRAAAAVDATVSRPHVHLASGDRATVGWRAHEPRIGWPRVKRRFDQRIAGLAARIACRLPALDIACFMSAGSARCDGAPLGMSEYLRDAHPQVRQVWAYRRRPELVPDWAVGVRAGSARHRWLAARARWWVTDGEPMAVQGAGGAPLRRGPRTRLLVTVEPTIQRVGSDQRDWPLLPSSRRRPATPRDVDLVAAASTFVADTVVPALGHQAPVVVGAPLQEAIVRRTDARRGLDLPVDRPVVLWAWVGSAPPPVEDLARELNGSVQLLVHGRGASVPAAVRAWTRDVTGRVPTDTLVAACDLVVTDASPLAVRAARAGRPVIVFAPDIRDLVSRGPGLYVDWPQDAPGPVIGDVESLAAVIHESLGSFDAVPAQYRQAHDRFAALAADELVGGSARIWAALTGGAT